MSIFIKTNGVYLEEKKPLNVKTGGVFTATKDVYVKLNGVYVKSYKKPVLEPTAKWIVAGYLHYPEYNLYFTGYWVGVPNGYIESGDMVPGWVLTAAYTMVSDVNSFTIQFTYNGTYAETLPTGYNYVDVVDGDTLNVVGTWHRSEFTGNLAQIKQPMGLMQIGKKYYIQVRP